MTRTPFKQEHYHFSLVLILVGSLILGSLGPFGQIAKLALFERIGLLVVYFVLGLPLLWFSYQSCRIYFDRDRIGQRIAGCALSAFIASAPVLLVIEVIGYSQGRIFPPDMPALMRALSEVFIIGFPTILLLDLIDYMLSPKSRAVANEPLAFFPGLGDLSQIYAIKAEGHYARVYGSQGDRLTDQSFNEMLELMSGQDGAQVHRSWWVAKDHIRKVKRKGSAMEFILADGHCAPIARRRVSELRNKGWQL